jgi:hypothetical protein
MCYDERRVLLLERQENIKGIGNLSETRGVLPEYTSGALQCHHPRR